MTAIGSAATTTHPATSLALSLSRSLALSLSRSLALSLSRSLYCARTPRTLNQADPSSTTPYLCMRGRHTPVSISSRVVGPPVMTPHELSTQASNRKHHSLVGFCFSISGTLCTTSPLPTSKTPSFRSCASARPAAMHSNALRLFGTCGLPGNTHAMVIRTERQEHDCC